MRSWWLIVGAVMIGCGDAGSTDDGSDDTGPGVEPPPWAPLASLSEGQCPALDQSGTSTFQSGGFERKVNIQLPSGGVTPGMPVLFTWHGLTTPDSNPIQLMVQGFGLADMADQYGAIIVTPEARTQSIPLVGSFSLWSGLIDDTTPDMVLYDDLRTCLSQTHDVDLGRIYSWGHSGGALWTSALLIERANTLAAAVVMSGGVDVELPLVNGGLALPYSAPAATVPVVLSSGGQSDVWPDATFTIINFENTTEHMGQRLAGDGHYVVRCQHELGHYQLPPDLVSFGPEFMFAHAMGEASPYAEGEQQPLSWCEVETAQ